MSALTSITTTRFSLERTSFGKLVLTNAAGERFEGVVPVRAFPIQSPDDGISLVSTDGKEVAWVDLLAEVPEPAQGLIRAELATREFMPVIERIVSVTSYSTPCTWAVKTDRGDTEFVLRGDEDIRRIGKEHALLIADAHGIQYLVRDQFALDAHSKRVLDRFL
ncbi:DUF1854 domain-containing protein [Rhodoferax saidenbachensis]|jgi:hypothetical protein|uniref:DUF1854 domain-containing protein n=1 Tax=Rhodoferax saidenbachensis TaxID=1484693 RepID=A0ABU1ZLW3_9BURK|nr:DUF1854 domain-containing protein [Rhodoferax saidenbachensis]MDR7305551.1 hypothetical protein [Rhodoferax saidenbachensis]